MPRPWSGGGSTWAAAGIAVSSCAAWAAIALLGSDGRNVVAMALVVVLASAVAVLIVRRRLVTALAVVAYLSALEPGLRRYLPEMPYLALEYLVVGYTGLLLIVTRKPVRGYLPLVFYAGYVLLDLAGMLRALDPKFARTVFMPALALLLLVVVAFQVRLGAAAVWTLSRAYVLGAAGIGILVLQMYARGEVVSWATASNSAASGGMGPNQVSFIFSAAVFLCLVLGQQERRGRRLLYWGTAAGLSYLMILTFSRGGLYIASGAVLLYYVLLQRPSRRTMLAATAYALAVVLVFQLAIGTTAGAIIQRYNEFDTSNRTELVRQAWRIFLDNPFVGVGTGNYYIVVAQDDYFGSRSGSHNEVLRAAAEHGLPGLLLWIGFAGAAIAQSSIGFRGRERALRLSLLAVALVSVTYIGLKLLSQSMLVLLALAAFTAGEPWPEDAPGDAAARDEGHQAMALAVAGAAPATVHGGTTPS